MNYPLNRKIRNWLNQFFEWRPQTTIQMRMTLCTFISALTPIINSLVLYLLVVNEFYCSSRVSRPSLDNGKKANLKIIEKQKIFHLLSVHNYDMLVSIICHWIIRFISRGICTMDNESTIKRGDNWIICTLNITECLMKFWCERKDNMNFKTQSKRAR